MFFCFSQFKNSWIGKFYTLMYVKKCKVLHRWFYLSISFLSFSVFQTSSTAYHVQTWNKEALEMRPMRFYSCSGTCNEFITCFHEFWVYEKKNHEKSMIFFSKCYKVYFVIKINRYIGIVLLVLISIENFYLIEKQSK